MVGLGNSLGGISCEATSVSDDGSVIVGRSRFYESSKAFVWDGVNGMRSMQSVLTNDYRLDLSNWTLTEATGVSADGKTIVGNGKHNGHIEAWIVHLDRPVNEAGKEKPKRK